MMTEYELRRKFVVIEVRNRRKEVLGVLKLNLFTLWTGPYHLDFQLALPNSPQCRLSLNFKISQGISLAIRTLKAQLLPSEGKGLQERFTMSAEAIVRVLISRLGSKWNLHLMPIISAWLTRQGWLRRINSKRRWLTSLNWFGMKRRPKSCLCPVLSAR
jgi:hypothetical protein